MKLKLLLLLILFLKEVFRLITLKIKWNQYEKPLPEEVSDIYDEEAYEKFISHKRDYLKPVMSAKCAGFITDLVIILSPFYHGIEMLGRGNVYLIVILTLVLSFVINLITDIPYSYYVTFVIEEKYGLNRFTKKAFFKDYAIEEITGFIQEVLLILVITIICRIVSRHFLETGLSLFPACLVSAGICLAVFGFGIILSFISYFSLRKQYRFTEMPEGDLRTKIEELTKGAKKKIRRIEVYNESEKSTSKNAFLLRLLWIRQFGIADNFINENDERELLAVLAHEAGHLKHRNDLFNYAKHIVILVIFAAVSYALQEPGIITGFAEVIRNAFDLQVNNYALIILVISILITPLTKVTSVYSNWVSRRDEKEADYNAVKEGYGEELIATFKRMSNAELIDVNPAPFIEFCDYSHPGMYQRIRYIRKAMEGSREE